LIDLLESEHDTVREWATHALGQLGIADATEPVRSAYWACIRRRIRPDWTEPSRMRWALTRLGSRHPVIPSLTGQLIVDTPELKSDTTWPSKNLNDVISDLADNAVKSCSRIDSAPGVSKSRCEPYSIST